MDAADGVNNRTGNIGNCANSQYIKGITIVAILIIQRKRRTERRRYRSVRYSECGADC